MTAPITSINVITLRWLPPRIWFEDHDRIPAFVEFPPKDVFDERMHQLDRFVRANCPSTHIEYYVFVFVIACVACSAGFSLAARSADISMWYPLVLLLIPAGLSYWTSRRRATLVHRIRQFELALKQTLREFNKTDRIKWSFRRPTANDALPSKYKSARLCLVIEMSRYAEELPSYHTAVMSSTLLIDPTVPTPPPPSYSQSNLHQHLDATSSASVAESTTTTAPTLLYTSANSSQISLPLSHPEPAIVRPSPTFCNASSSSSPSPCSSNTNGQHSLHPCDSLTAGRQQ